MNGRLKSAAHNFAHWLSSRNNDWYGYWALGIILASTRGGNIANVEFSLTRGVRRQNGGVLGVLEEDYRRFFAAQLEKQSVPPESASDAAAVFSFDRSRTAMRVHVVNSR
ncbi:MAG: hypothetical protein DHS20C21_02850 [Gemmatimonadota bacterium]|nr:MAG: hypothetical protein DHS20C21_02850 [Gemmatimonadota bacterium]